MMMMKMKMKDDHDDDDDDDDDNDFDLELIISTQWYFYGRNPAPPVFQERVVILHINWLRVRDVFIPALDGELVGTPTWVVIHCI